MHSRRARPTLRVLREDLPSGWSSPHVQRAWENGDLSRLGPLSELDHPLVEKARETFGSDGARDSAEGLIRSATQFSLWEVKAGQWRGGVWRDPTSGVCWLIAGGLAKGGHVDRDDFYEVVARVHASKRAAAWLPAPEDQKLLKLETAARLHLESQLEIQRDTADALQACLECGRAEFDIRHPAAQALPPTQAVLAHVTLVVTEVRGDGTPTDDVTVEIAPDPRWSGSETWWSAALRVMISISAPEQSWDAFGTSFSTIGEPGTWTVRLGELRELVADGVLAESHPGLHAHYAHRQHLAGSTVEGRAVRAMCGAFFVPYQDVAGKPVCPECEDALRGLPGE